jgi:hypothetical protein
LSVSETNLPKQREIANSFARAAQAEHRAERSEHGAQLLAAESVAKPIIALHLQQSIIYINKYFICRNHYETIQAR